MIKDFETYINEDYFSKLASRLDNGEVRKENIQNDITEEYVRSFVDNDHVDEISSISIREENGKSIVDIDGNFHIVDNIKRIPFQFGTITGDFFCAVCDNLVSLNGCPEEVGGDFSCAGNPKLLSLEGCPKKVGGRFFCGGCGKEFSLEYVLSLCDVGNQKNWPVFFRKISV